MLTDAEKKYIEDYVAEHIARYSHIANSVEEQQTCAAEALGLIRQANHRRELAHAAMLKITEGR